MGIPVWAVALMLVIGTVAGAAIWILTVEVPVEYDEPVDVYYSSEDMIDGRNTTVPQGDADWVGPLNLRETRRTNPSDLTYGTLHDYLRAENPSNGKNPANLTVEIQAYNDTDAETEEIGFVVINETLAGPQDIDNWQYTNENRTAAVYNGTTYPVEYGYTQFNHSLNQGEMVNYTVINVVAEYDDAGNNVNVNGYEIVWDLYDNTEEN